MPAPTSSWDEVTTRRERVYGVAVRRRGKRVAKARDRIIIDDVVEFLTRSMVNKYVRGLPRDTPPEVPQKIKDYLTKQGITLPGS